MSYSARRQKLIESLPLLTTEIIENTDAFLRDVDPAKQYEWAKKRTVVHHFGERAYRMVVDLPDDGDKNRAVVVPGEFSNGITLPATLRARIIRDMVDPTATLIMQPNTTFGQPNMNYSRLERRRLSRGKVDPLLGRIATTLGLVDSPEDLTLVGASQGSVPALELATKDYIPPPAVVALEAPGVVERSHPRLLWNFLRCGADLADVIKENYSDSDHPLLIDTIKGLSAKERVNYALGALSPENIATLGIIVQGRARRAMHTILHRGGSVVHAWGTKDEVSPPVANRAIAQELSESARYIAYELEGADHSISNSYTLVGALASQAHVLRVSN